MTHAGITGVILDASALATVRSSMYVQTWIAQVITRGGLIVVPATAMSIAVGAGDIDPTELQHPQITVTALTEVVAASVGTLLATASAAMPLDIAHAAYEATTTHGYPVLTAEQQRYRNLAVAVDTEPID